LSSIKVSGANGNVVYTVVDLETYMSTGHKDLHRLSSLLRDIDGVDVAIVFTQRGTEEIQVSFRSKSSVDVSAVAELFGGGGHKNASGCTIYGKSLDDAVSIVLDKVEIAIKS
jgi:phosphoesterase RecJ-like protein